MSKFIVEKNLRHPNGEFYGTDIMAKKIHDGD